MYDKCAYSHRLAESTSPLAYQIYPPGYESCQPCMQGYPGFFPSVGSQGQGFSVPPSEIDVESDLRNQTRINSLCPSKKYLPRCNQPSKKSGYPCAQTLNRTYRGECMPGIIPVSSVDSRMPKPCNPLSAVHINRFDFLCENPQQENKWRLYNGNNRLGIDTYQTERDRNNINWKNVSRRSCYGFNMRNNRTQPCRAGSLSCASIADSVKNILGL